MSSPLCPVEPMNQLFAPRLETADEPYKVDLAACVRNLLVILNTMIDSDTY